MQGVYNPRVRTRHAYETSHSGTFVQHSIRLPSQSRVIGNHRLYNGSMHPHNPLVQASVDDCAFENIL